MLRIVTLVLVVAGAWLGPTASAGGGEGSVVAPEVRIHRAASASDRARTLELAEGCAVVPAGDSALASLAHAYTRARRSQAVPQAERRLIAAGPVLDAPDAVEVVRVELAASGIEIDVIHTSARRSGTPLRRNVQWRPLLELALPDEAPPGPARVRWTPVDSLKSRTPLADPIETRCGPQSEPSP